VAKKELRLDEIGVWSEIKLEIVKKYAAAYSTILSNQPAIKGHVYVDALAGAGTHISKTTGEEVAGSPLNAMRITPPFSELHFIDLDGTRTAALRRLATDDSRVTVHDGDCNDVLLRKVFPRCRYDEFRRALCLLDPYKLNVSWEVLRTAGEMKSLEVFYNFMIMDANMNVLWKDPGKVKPAQKTRMDAVWGDDSWRTDAYEKTQDLFGEVETKAGNDAVAEAFRKRLRDVAGFKFVPRPIPMRNRMGAVVYYLFFASPNATGAKIVNAIFDKYRSHGAT
jgi:three-Cys-motif partner protein